MEFKLTIAAPLKPTDIPSEESILAAAYAVLDSTSLWKQGKTFCKDTVKTFSSPKGSQDGAPWHCRVSKHNPEEATFDVMWSKLGKDKAINEKEFIPEIHKVTQVKHISPTQSIWTLQYKFSPPISPRVFTVLQVVHLSESFPQTGTVVSIPVDLTGDAELAKLEEKGVKGRYVSVERIIELPDGGLEWRMATSSTPGGRIPTFISESAMAGKISDDVPHFMKWVRSLEHTN
jgi:hypothetical protein